MMTNNYFFDKICVFGFLLLEAILKVKAYRVMWKLSASESRMYRFHGKE